MIKGFTKFKREENGGMMVLFACMFSVLILFLSFATDLAMMYGRRARMYEIGHVMRQARFTKDQNTFSLFLNSDNPGREYGRVFNEYARKNGFKGKITVTYDEEHPSKFGYQRREFRLNMKLEEVYDTTTLKIIGIDKVPIVVNIKGYGHKTQGSGPIWYPNNSTFTHNEEVYPGEN